jgi:hypothetical protein
MIKKSRLPLLLVLIFILEALIYLWAVLMTEPEFVTDKCARNSGRVSSMLNLAMLLMIGYYGLSNIYNEQRKKDIFLILITLFAVNHLTHFFYIYQNFKHHTMDLNISDNKHGFITFVFVLAIPVLLWTVKNFSALLYFIVVAHLFNVSYFICETFYNKVKPDKPAYHNQFGILVTCLACFYILYRVFLEMKAARSLKNS